MAKKKKEETNEQEIENVNDEELAGTLETDRAVEEDKPKPVERRTPFGIEVWDPEKKTTTMKPNG